MENIMIDTETLGTLPGCVILSIGAVEFDANGFGKEFEILIDPESCVEAGLKIDPRTVMWWMSQNDAARNSLLTGVKTPLNVALGQFAEAFDWQGKKVWCNGASFDFPILAAAYDAFNCETPWKYFDCMDYRTVKGLLSRKEVNDIEKKVAKKFKRCAHKALDDAKHQALMLTEMIWSE